jgi:MFS family permease
MEERQFSPYRWVIEGVLLPLQIGMGLNFMAPAPLFPKIMEHYDINRGTVSLLVAAVTVVVTVFLIPGGILVARIGPRKAIPLGGLLMAAGVLAPVAHSFWAVVALRFMFGMGVSIAFPATSAVTVQWFRSRELPVINGVNLAGQSIGVAVAMIIGAPIANAMGWRMALFLFGAFTLVGVTLWLAVGRSAPTPKEPPLPFSPRDVLPVLFERNTLLLSIGAAGPFALFIGFSTWLPSYYHDVLGMSISQASAMVAILPIMGVVVNPISGLLQARVGRRKPFLLVPGIVFPLAALGTFLLFTHPVPIAISAMVLGICFSMFVPALMTIPMELPGITIERVAIVTAAALTMGNLATVISPLFIGALTDALGSYLPSLIVVALLPLTLVIAALAIPETGPKASRLTADTGKVLPTKP